MEVYKICIAIQQWQHAGCKYPADYKSQDLDMVPTQRQSYAQNCNKGFLENNTFFFFSLFSAFISYQFQWRIPFVSRLCVRLCLQRCRKVSSQKNSTCDTGVVHFYSCISPPSCFFLQTHTIKHTEFYPPQRFLRLSVSGTWSCLLPRPR